MPAQRPKPKAIADDATSRHAKWMDRQLTEVLGKDYGSLQERFDAVDEAIAAAGVSTHASTHVRGASDEVDGDFLDIDYIPSGYSRTVSGLPGPTDPATSAEHLAAHLSGISHALTDQDARIDDLETDMPVALARSALIHGVVQNSAGTGGVQQYVRWNNYGSTTGTEALGVFIAPRAGTCRRLITKPGGSTAAAGYSTVYVVRKNGSNTSVTVTNTDVTGTAAVIDTTNSFTFAQGDTLTIGHTPSSGAGGFTNIAVSVLLEFEP